LRQKAALEARLVRLKEVLADLVEAAKKRSGVEEESKTKETDTKETKPDKPLTAKEKREKREAAKEAYEKEKKTSVSQEVAQLQSQIASVRDQIEAAIAAARRNRSSKSKSQTASNGR
jgi:ADP-ribosylglycohydrolase